MLSELCEGVYDVDISHHSDVFLEQNLVPWCLPSFSHIKLVSFPSQLTSTSVIFKPGSIPMRALKFWARETAPFSQPSLKKHSFDYCGSFWKTHAEWLIQLKVVYWRV